MALSVCQSLPVILFVRQSTYPGYNEQTCSLQLTDSVWQLYTTVDIGIYYQVFMIQIARRPDSPSQLTT